MSLNMKNGKGFLEEVVFILNLGGSVVFKQLEMGFREFESLKCKQCVLWVFKDRKIRLKMTGYGLWIVPSVMLRRLGFLSQWWET